MKKEKIVAFAKRNGYDNVISLGKWREYDAYEPVMAGATEENPAYTGPPLLILVVEDTIRMSTPEEGLAHIHETAETDEIDEI